MDLFLLAHQYSCCFIVLSTNKASVMPCENILLQGYSVLYKTGVTEQTRKLFCHVSCNIASNHSANIFAQFGGEYPVRAPVLSPCLWESTIIHDPSQFAINKKLLLVVTTTPQLDFRVAEKLSASNTSAN